MCFRVYLDLLKSPDEAVRIVRGSGSVEGAKMVARYIHARKTHPNLQTYSHNSVVWIASAYSVTL